MTPQQFVLTTPEIRTLVERLERVRLPQRTLSNWMGRSKLLRPSIRWDHQRGRSHVCLWSLDDVARLRLIVRLRKVSGFSPTKLREVLRYLDASPEFRQALRHINRGYELVAVGERVLVRKPGEDAEIDVPRGQFTFRFAVAELFAGNEAEAQRVVNSAA